MTTMFNTTIISGFRLWISALGVFTNFGDRLLGFPGVDGYYSMPHQLQQLHLSVLLSCLPASPNGVLIYRGHVFLSTPLVTWDRHVQHARRLGTLTIVPYPLFRMEFATLPGHHEYSFR